MFVDNHDTERNGESMSYKWGAKYILANTFLLSWPYGSPTVYSGYEFSNNDAGAPGATETTRPRRDLRRRAVDLHAALDGDPRHGRLPQRGRRHGGHRTGGTTAATSSPTAAATGGTSC